MNEKDKQIERLFDDYASSLQPNTHLAGKAMERMRDKKKPKRKIVVWGGLAAASGALLVAVFVVPAVIGRSGSSKSNGNDNTHTPAVSSTTNYSISEVRASKVDASFASDYINLNIPSDAQIFSEKYYACYIKDSGEFVYLKAVLGISYNGGNIQMSVVAEKSDYAGKELSAEYKYLMRDTGYTCYTDYIQGEHVTMAYLKTDEYNYYVSAMGNVYGAQDIAEYLVNID
ncbi:MAG: hypothetical protein J1G04_05670 [Clostridiales bacterium]|nr:hypothetical protein [Clostridiales bacterium]